MIIYSSVSYMEKALKFAKETGNNTLNICIDTLRELEWKESFTDLFIYVSKDMPPYSFCFELKDRNRKSIVKGTVIYHRDPDESGVIQDIPYIGWEIHT